MSRESNSLTSRRMAVASPPPHTLLLDYSRMTLMAQDRKTINEVPSFSVLYCTRFFMTGIDLKGCGGSDQ